MAEQFLSGQFSKQVDVSKRMLRHFEQLGLLTPCFIDPDNGHRYYNKTQLLRVEQIKYLQHLGFTLKEIRSFIDANISISEFLDNLKDKEVNYRVLIDQQVSHLAGIQQCIEFLTKQTTKTLNLETLNESLVVKGSYLMEAKQAIKALPNSYTFFEHIDSILQQENNTDYAFLTIDLDQFASINDDYGFDVGDQVIYRCYDLLIQSFGSILDQDNQLLCRFGGDEFALFIYNKTKETVTDLANEMLKRLEAYDFRAIGARERITGTLGICYSKKPLDSRLYHHESTKALLEAKRLGRNQVFIIEK